MRTQQLLSTAAFIFTACYFMACRDTVNLQGLPEEKVKADEARAKGTKAAIGYALQVPQSMINWKATYVVGGGHEGTLKPESGDLAIDTSGKWVGGYFVVDMNTISSTDLKEAGERGSLEKHLKDDDFFAVQKYPKAYFTLTGAFPTVGVNTLTISGNLTIKNVTHNITFPVTLETVGNQLTVRASLKIDRTKWGVNYQSGSVFSNLKDDVISDELPLTLHLVFKKKEGC